MGAPPRNMEFEVTMEGCMVCTSHKHNKDGYLRVCDRRIQGTGRKALTMFHRVVWECSIGPIPEGYEVDHLCRNRGCQNIRHLQLLTIAEHKAKTNTERADDKRSLALEHWKKTGCSNVELEKLFSVNPGTGARWHRYWKSKNETC